MTIGIRVRNPDNGEVILDSNDKLTTMIGEGATRGRDGRIDIPHDGEPFYLLKDMGSARVGNYQYPEFTAHQGSISWRYPYGDSYGRVLVSFIYGVVV